MSQEPPRHLTDRNGVMCPNCWKTIDLTNKSAILPKKPWLKKTWSEKLHMHTIYDIHVKCPHCGEVECVSTENVYPMEATWEEQRRAYEDRIRILKAQLEETKADAKELARIAHQNIPEDSDSPEKLPPDSIKKAPSPPKGPELETEGGPYT